MPEECFRSASGNDALSRIVRSKVAKDNGGGGPPYGRRRRSSCRGLLSMRLYDKERVSSMTINRSWTLVAVLTFTGVGYWSLCLSKPSSKRLSILFVYIVAVTPLLRLSINARTVLSMRMMCLSACFIRLLTKTCASKICPSKRMPSHGGNDVLRKDSTLPESSFIRRSCSERRWSIRLSI